MRIGFAITHRPNKMLIGLEKMEARNMQGEEKSEYQMHSGNRSTVWLCRWRCWNWLPGWQVQNLAVAGVLICGASWEKAIKQKELRDDPCSSGVCEYWLKCISVIPHLPITAGAPGEIKCRNACASYQMVQKGSWHQKSAYKMGVGIILWSIE